VAGSGGEHAAAVYALIGTAKLNDCCQRNHLLRLFFVSLLNY
jgi:hypothetical protein